MARCHRDAPGAAAPVSARDIDGKFGNAAVAGPPAIVGSGCEGQYGAVIAVDHDDRMTAVEPISDLLGRTRFGLKCRDAVGDPSL